MVESILGTRIRERRRQSGIAQAELARRIGISASYLNLIERNKRRIAGPLLLKVAAALGTNLEDLDGASERRLAEALTEIAHLPTLDTFQIDARSAGTFIGQFPGWARAVAALARSERDANATAQALADRLSHDPFLAESVHRMLSRVSAIRSAAEILTDFDDLAASERSRFQTIVRHEAETLTHVGEALARYFEASDPSERNMTPTDEVEALFDRVENRFPELEEGGHQLSGLIAYRSPVPPHVAADAIAREHLTDTIAGIIEAAPEIQSVVAAERARARLIDYAAGAILLPGEAFAEQARALRYDIEILSGVYRLGVDRICHRLTALPRQQGTPRFGHVRANASGTITEMIGLPGLAFPRYAAACPLWVLYRGQQAPETILRQQATFPNGESFVFVARARNTGMPGFAQPRHYLTDMIAMSVEDARHTVYQTDQETLTEEVGPACRLCPRSECRHRVDDPLGA